MYSTIIICNKYRYLSNCCASLGRRILFNKIKLVLVFSLYVDIINIDILSYHTYKTTLQDFINERFNLIILKSILLPRLEQPLERYAYLLQIIMAEYVYFMNKISIILCQFCNFYQKKIMGENFVKINLAIINLIL